MLKLKYFIIIGLLLSFNSLFAQSDIPEYTQNPTAPYRLFRTQNMWIFIKLDTITGKMWQVQFDVKGDNQSSVVLSSEEIVGKREKIPGRYTLYATANMYNFILLDQIDGFTYQVQWSFEKKYRGIISIE